MHDSRKPAWHGDWSIDRSPKKISESANPHAGLRLSGTKLPVQICTHCFPELAFLCSILASLGCTFFGSFYLPHSLSLFLSSLNLNKNNFTTCGLGLKVFSLFPTSMTIRRSQQVPKPKNPTDCFLMSCQEKFMILAEMVRYGIGPTKRIVGKIDDCHKF